MTAIDPPEAGADRPEAAIDPPEAGVDRPQAEAGPPGRRGVLVLAGTDPRRVDCRVLELTRGGCRVAVGDRRGGGPADGGLPDAGLPDEATGLVAVAVGGGWACRPFRQARPAGDGEVHLVLARVAGGPDAWDALAAGADPA